ncbi:MAG: PHP domain-containing protein [Victivallales bacterium]|nr:PHP domain-containing protein [Victivallales bacterium]
MIDLHCHTTASDGVTPPGELPRLAESQGLSAVAITDHDTIDGVQDFLDAACIDVIPGIELSAQGPNGENIHLVGLFIDHTAAPLLETLETLRRWRDERNMRLLRNIIDTGVDITFEEVSALSDGVIGRPHIADVLINKGYCKDSQDAFRRYLGERAPTYVQKEALPYGKAIEVIHASGGLAIWAHPMARTSMTNTKFKKILADFVAAGLDGVEAYYPEHTITRRMTVEHEAEVNGLLVSGGSDYHGGSRHVGVLPGGFSNGAPLCVPDELLERMKRRIKAR